MEKMEFITLVLNAAQVAIKAYELLKAHTKKVHDEELERYVSQAETLSRRISSVVNPGNHDEIEYLRNVFLHRMIVEIRQIKFHRDPNIRCPKHQEITLNKIEESINIPTKSVWADQKYNGLLFDLTAGALFANLPRVIRLEDGRFHWMNSMYKEEVLDALSLGQGSITALITPSRTLMEEGEIVDLINDLAFEMSELVEV